MPARAALRPRAVVCGLLALSAAACSQPGTPASLATSKKLDEATTAISVSCGYAEQIAAFGGSHAPGLSALELSAGAGVRKLAAVYHGHATDDYQGETVKQIVSDSVGLLGDCGLAGAQRELQRATAGH